MLPEDLGARRLHAKAVLVTLDVRTVTVLFVLVNLVLGIRAMR